MMEDINNAPVFATDDKLDRGFVNWFKALNQVIQHVKLQKG